MLEVTDHGVGLGGGKVMMSAIVLLLGEEASQSIGNTLWHVSTMFTHSAITLPEVNRFG